MGHVSQLAAHPLRLAFLAALGGLLVWLVLTRSLPHAIASSDPDLALRLYPDHPVALVAKAELLRKALLASHDPRLTGDLDKPDAQDEKPAAILSDQAPATAEEIAAQREALRQEIRSLATRIIAKDNLNARAFRLLAEVTDDPVRVRALMLEAMRRSRRETPAVFWLLHESFSRQDYPQVLDLADVILRTRPGLSPIVYDYITQIAEDAAGRPMVLDRILANPSWRTGFFQNLPKTARSANSPLDLMIAMKALGHLPNRMELKPYLDHLIARGQVVEAYNAWLQLLPPEQLKEVGFLRNPSFETDPGGTPFDWQISTPLNAVAEFSRRGSPNGQRGLHIAFFDGRITFPEVKQVVVLGAGHYSLAGRVHGTIISKRGLRWQVHCLGGARRMLAQSELISGESSAWREFIFEFDIPQTPDCSGQVVRLYHDARSASEQLISGEVWFDELRLSRAPG